MNSYATETELLLKAARKAGEVAMRHFAAAGAVEEKEDGSPVTAADRECERVISTLLADAFPDDGILGEEGAVKASRSRRRWLIDPIDGTRDFVRRNTFWSVQVALEDQGRIVAGAIHFPYYGDLLHAVAGGGCFWNGVRTRISETSRLDKAILAVSGLKSAWHVWPPDGIRALTEACWTVRSYGAAYDVAMLARGKVDMWLSGNGMEWDYAAARIIAEESGARFLTLDGMGRINAHHCLICVPGLEAAVRRILKMSAR